METAPIVLFVFRKPELTSRVLHALKENPLSDQSLLYIYADGPKPGASGEVITDIRDTRQVIRAKSWTKEVRIIESKKNKGLARSVIEGVTEVVSKHGKIIVMDDDQLPAKGFLQYMNHALNKYAHQNRVMQISAYIAPQPEPLKAGHRAYFIPFSGSTAWGTWKRAWDKFSPEAAGYEQLKKDPSMAERFDIGGIRPFTKMMIKQMEKEQIDSWAIRWWWAFFSHNGLALCPDKSLTQYLSSGNKATHVKGDDLPYTHPNFDADYYISEFPNVIEVHEAYYECMKKALQRLSDQHGNAPSPKKSWFRSMLSRLFNSLKQ